MKTFVLILALSVSYAAVAADTYQHRVVAAVLMGEAWGEGERGMLAVGEVIHQRAADKSLTPLQVVTKRAKSGKYAFSCLNGRGPENLVKKYWKEPVFQQALVIARIVCDEPEKLPGITHGANYFTRKEEKPEWARGRKPVAVVKAHAFYRAPL